MAHNDHAFALLIGIDDYRAYDPSGASDLHGSRGDVAGWWALTRQLGVPAANVRICTSPKLSPDALGEGAADATFTEATHAEIEAALRWLAASLDGERGTKALFTYGGHGAMTAAGEILCPSDVRRVGDTLDNALPVRAVAAILDQRAKRTRITAFVDTCHTPAPLVPGASRVRTLTGLDALADATPDAHRALGDLVLSSSGTGQPSFEIPLAVGVRGAFSWAAQTLLARWGTAEAADGASFGLTYGDICLRSGMMLAPLAIEQRPVFVGDPRAAGWRAFSAFGDRVVGASEPGPAGALEIWPEDSGGRVVQFKLSTSSSGGGTQLGTLYVTDANPPSGKGWDADRMYWHWTSGSFPTSTFYAVPDGVSTGSAPTSAIVYETTAMTAGYSGSTTSIPGGHYMISTTRHLGFVRPTTSALTVYGSNMGASTLAAGFETLEYNYASGSTSDVIYETAVDPKK